MQIKKRFPRRKVSIIAPARLHFGFLNWDQVISESMGSFGMTLNNFVTKIIVEKSKTLIVQGPQKDLAKKLVKRLLTKNNFSTSVKITIEKAIPKHSGLGSGTQLALALGYAVHSLFNKKINMENIAKLLRRGKRSGIGIGAFRYGGVLVDNGNFSKKLKSTKIPKIVTRIPFPKNWRIILIIDKSTKGIHGKKESVIFGKLPSYPERISKEFYKILITEAIPSLLNENIKNFGEAVTKIQKMIGRQFSKFQGGNYSSHKVKKAIKWLERMNINGYGQSSWGPTGFAFVGNEKEAIRIIQQANRKWDDEKDLNFVLCRGRNHGFTSQFF
jgi:beta-RFAP synthase